MSWWAIAVGAAFGALGGWIGDPVRAALMGGAAAGTVLAAGRMAQWKDEG